MSKIFITGSSGFIGNHLIENLKKLGLDFIAGDRAIYGDLISQNNWDNILTGCSSVVHLAARVHVMDELSTDPLTQFRLINVDATLRLAMGAKSVGVKRFIYISSIKVNGEETFENPFLAIDAPKPSCPYGISKMEAEIELLKLHEKGVFEIVIIRPPLVYGPGVKANLKNLFWLVNKDVPLPFGLAKNKRSLLSVYNLVDLIVLCIFHKNAGGEIFLVSDNTDYSIRELIILMAKVENKTPHFLPVPVSLMHFVANLLGKKVYADRLLGNLHVDIKKTKILLNWNPPHSFLSTYGSQSHSK